MKKIIVFGIILMLSVCISYPQTLQTPYQAVVIALVVDLVGQPMKTYCSNKTVADAYRDLPLCGGEQKPERSCPRIHQLLFNEVVTILEEQKDEVRIILENSEFGLRYREGTMKYVDLLRNTMYVLLVFSFFYTISCACSRRCRAMVLGVPKTI